MKDPKTSIEPPSSSIISEHAPGLFWKLGKNLGQNAVAGTVAIPPGRLFYVFERRILARLGQSEAGPDRTHRFPGFHGWRDRCCLRLLFDAVAQTATGPAGCTCDPGFPTYSLPGISGRGLGPGRQQRSRR